MAKPASQCDELMTRLPDPAALPFRLGPSLPIQGIPSQLCELYDSSLILASFVSGLAHRVWLDGSHPPQPLPVDEGANCVLHTNNGYLILHSLCELVAWKNPLSPAQDWTVYCIKTPTAAVVVGGSALISCRGFDGFHAGHLLELDLKSGRAVGSIGKGKLRAPHGVAICPDDKIHVVDCSSPRWESVEVISPDKRS